MSPCPFPTTITITHPIIFLILIYLTGISGLLSGTSFGWPWVYLGFSVSTSVLINGHKDFV